MHILILTNSCNAPGHWDRERESLARNCDVFVGAPGANNLRAQRAYEKLGWLKYPVLGTYGGFTSQGIYKRLHKSG